MSLNIKRLITKYVIPSFLMSIYLMIKYKCYISLKSDIQFTNNLIIGKKTKISSFVRIKAVEGSIRIGKNCTINSFSFIAAGEKDLIIGDDVLIGPFVSIHGSNYNYTKKNERIISQGKTQKGVRIGDDVWIGSHAVILDGVRIGKGTVIGAGAVVNRDIPPYSVAVGVPAKVIKKRD